MRDCYMDAAKEVIGEGSYFMNYVRVARVVEFLDRTKWACESITMDHLTVDGIIREVCGDESDIQP